MKHIELSKEEIEVLDEIVFRRMINLENLGLTDAKCYPILNNIHLKLRKEN